MLYIPNDLFRIFQSKSFLRKRNSPQTWSTILPNMWKYHFMNEASPQGDTLKQCSYRQSFYSTCIWAIRNTMREEKTKIHHYHKL